MLDNMTWSVHLTERDANGGVRRQFVGSFLLGQLPAALAAAFRRASGSRAGIQVVRDQSLPAPLRPDAS